MLTTFGIEVAKKIIECETLEEMEAFLAEHGERFWGGV
jgi:hypothetical protein